MGDCDLVRLWSMDAPYVPGAPSDDWLIFKPDGTGRYEFHNWILCSADFYRWEMAKPGVLRMTGERCLQISEDARSLDARPSLFAASELEYSIHEEDTPSGKRMRILRLGLTFPMSKFFGFVRVDLAGLEEPRFDFETEPPS